MERQGRFNKSLLKTPNLISSHETAIMPLNHLYSKGLRWHRHCTINNNMS